jgi:hypothetical protein
MQEILVDRGEFVLEYAIKVLDDGGIAFHFCLRDGRWIRAHIIRTPGGLATARPRKQAEDEFGSQAGEGI